MTGSAPHATGPAGSAHPRGLAVEIAVTSAGDARRAAAAGADRLELCSSLELGGVTPSLGSVEESLEADIPVHVLIRPRPGDFVYDEAERRTMRRDVRSILAAGAHGVVIGALTDAGELDLEVLQPLIEEARAFEGAEVTVHRAVDQALDPLAALTALQGIAVDRVLSSGGAASVIEGLGLLREFCAAEPGVQVMAGGGVAVGDLPALHAAGMDAVHLSAKRRIASAARGPALGAADDGARFGLDEAIVRAARGAADALG